jgi:hypothetical protein
VELEAPELHLAAGPGGQVPGSSDSRDGTAGDLGGSGNWREGETEEGWLNRIGI